MKRIINVLLLSVIVFISGCGIEQIDEGSRGVETHWGKVVGDPLTPGLYFYNPVTSNILEMDVKEHKTEGKTSCFTNDTQKVDVDYAVTYYPKPERIGHLYAQFGTDWNQKILSQVVLGSIKDVVGQYKADDLVGKREKARKDSEAELKAMLSERDIIVTKLDFTNLDFDDGYEKAVENKVIAMQKAAEAKNKTVEIEEEAKQTIRKAEAEARSMTIRSQALSQNKGLVEYEIAQKWDGKLPQTMFGNSMPLLNLNGFGKKTAE